jgi:hypothetical protein
VVFVGAVVDVDELEGPIAGGVHEACHVHHRVEDGDAEAARGVGIGGRGFDRLVGPEDRNLQVLLQDLEQRLGVEVLDPDPRADFARQVVERVGKRLVVDMPQTLDQGELARRGVELQGRLEFRGRRRLHHFDVGDAKLTDPFLQLLEKAGVAHRGEPFRRVRRDEGAFALDFDEQVLTHQLAQRFPQRDAADGELLAEVVFGRNLRAGRIEAAVNAMANQVLDLVIERDPQFLAESAFGRVSCHGSARQHTIGLTQLV